MTDEPAWTIGVEEEYLLMERESGALITKQPPGLLQKVANLRHGLVARELFSSQIEIGTGVCTDMKYLRADLGLLRLAVTEAAAEYGMAPIAASAHPFARWYEQQYTEAERYQALTADLQGVTRRLVISGMHVHVGIEDPDLRIDLMDQAAYFLPHLLALSTSSPFWEGRDTECAYDRGMAGAVVMVIVLVILFPVAVLVGSGIIAAALGSLLKVDSDAANRTDDGPNEYLDLASKEAETGYPRLNDGHERRRRLSLPGIRRS